MNYNIKGTGLAISDELRAYVERQLAHAERLVGTSLTAYADIELEYSQLNDAGKYRAEFTVACDGAVYRAEAQGGGMHEAIDIAGAELVAELRQSKKKRLHVLRRSALKVKEYLRGWRRKV